MKVELTTPAVQDLARLPAKDAAQILKKIQRLEGGLVGDIKALKHAEFGYRLRSGDWKVLFDLEKVGVVIRRIKNRRDAYE